MNGFYYLAAFIKPVYDAKASTDGAAKLSYNPKIISWRQNHRDNRWRMNIPKGICFPSPLLILSNPSFYFPMHALSQYSSLRGLYALRVLRSHGLSDVALSPKKRLSPVCSMPRLPVGISPRLKTGTN